MTRGESCSLERKGSEVPLELLTRPGALRRRTAWLASFPALASLQNREFRLLWLGLIGAFLGSWMQQVAMGWWVFDKAHSAFLLGLVNASGALPMLLLSLVAGVAADRLDRRRLLMITRSVQLVVVLTLATLIAFDWATVWHVLAISLVSGVVFAFDIPARQSLVPMLVERHQLMNAMALNSAVWNGSQILGPAVAGNLVGFVGTAGCLFMAACLSLGIIVALMMMRIPEGVQTARGDSLLGSIKDGLKTVRADELVMSMIAASAVIVIFGMPYAVFMPVFAGDVLNVGASGLGFLMAATGVGALIGALGLASLGDYEHKGILLLAMGITFSVALISFSASRWFPLSLGLLTVVGMSGTSASTIMTTFVLSRVEAEFQGRVMSVLMLAFGLQPVGSIMFGGMANMLGAPLAVAAGATICLVFIAGVFLRRPSLINAG